MEIGLSASTSSLVFKKLVMRYQTHWISFLLLRLVSQEVSWDFFRFKTLVGEVGRLIGILFLGVLRSVSVSQGVEDTWPCPEKIDS